MNLWLDWRHKECKCWHVVRHAHGIVAILLPLPVTSVQLLGVTLQFHAPEQRDTAKDVLLFLVQHSVMHCHCLFMTLTQFCACQKTVLFGRAYETLAQRLRDSLGCKDFCTNTNSLTYLLTCRHCGVDEDDRSADVIWRVTVAGAERWSDVWPVMEVDAAAYTYRWSARQGSTQSDHRNTRHVAYLCLGNISVNKWPGKVSPASLSRF